MPKYYALLVALLIAPSVSNALTAMTEDGDTVILRSDKTWEYENQRSAKSDQIIETNKIIKRPTSATFGLKARSTSFKVYIDPKKWKILNKDKDAENRINFISRENSSIYGTIIAESMELSLPTLLDAVIKNAKDFTPDITINKKEYRTINNTKSVYLEMDANHKGTNFSYQGVYSADKFGSIQLFVYSTREILEQHQNLVNEILSGLEAGK